MRFKIRRVDHDRLFLWPFGGQTLHDPSKDAHVAPPLPAIVEGIRRAILPRRISPPQAVAIDEDYAAQDPPVIDTRLTVALWKEGLQPRHLLGCSQKKLLIDHAPRGA